VLDFSLDRPAVPPKDAATLVLVRDAGAGVDVFCVERNKRSRFVGGAIVFPGGKLDPADADDAWTALVTPPRAFRDGFATDERQLRALAVAAARETLEEAAILHVAGTEVDDATLRTLQGELAAEPTALARFLTARGARLDLAALHPFARWVTPEAEARRYDTRFFVAVAPRGQSGAHDEHETMASFWAAPAEVLRRFEAGDVQLVPPTHRSLELLATCADTASVLALAEAASLAPIMPRLVPSADGALALVLPGDPEHASREALCAGRSRYVLRGDRWLPEDAPR
jgi:8-oxo-dGTP pyrophosphatase MutT (NUDIX family)